MDRLYRSNVEGAKRIRAVTSDDISVDDSIDDWMESNGGYVRRRGGDSECEEDARSYGYCCNEMGGTDSCFISKDKTKWGKVKEVYIHIRRR